MDRPPPRRSQVVRLHVVDRPARDHADRQGVEPDVLLERIAGPVVLAQQLPGFVVDEQRGAAGSGAPHLFAGAGVGVAGSRYSRLYPDALFCQINVNHFQLDAIHPVEFFIPTRSFGIFD